MNLQTKMPLEKQVFMQHQETNTRLYDRNVPSQMLQPYIDVRPVMTKYSYFPIVDPRSQPNVRLQQQPVYSPHSVFNPGNTKSPWSGYASSVNKESELRNQIFALQTCSQAAYVPNSDSDLYQYNFQPKAANQTHQLLFEKQGFNHFNPNPEPKIIGNQMFMNSTRCQIKENVQAKC